MSATVFDTLHKRIKEFELPLKGVLGAEDFKWQSYTPPPVPTARNTEEAIKKPLPAFTFERTQRAIATGITLPSEGILSVSIAGLPKITWAPLKPFPSTTIPEVQQLNDTIYTEQNKVTAQVNVVVAKANDMTSEKFKEIPDFDITKPGRVIDAIRHNVKVSNSIFSKAQSTVLATGEAIKRTMSAAGTITTQIGQVLNALPGRIKQITDAIAKTINDNAQTLVNDIGRNAQDVAKQISEGLAKAIKNYTTELSKNITTFFKGINDAMATDLKIMFANLNSYFLNIVDAIKKDFNGINDYIRNVMNGLNQNITNNVLLMKDKIDKDLKLEISKFQDAITGAKNEMVRTMDEKVRFVQSQVNTMIEGAKADVNKLMADTKTEVNKSLDATKTELNTRVVEVTQQINTIKAQIDATAGEVKAQAKSVEEVKAQIVALADQVKTQAQGVNTASADILKIRDDMKALSDKISGLEVRQKATEEKPKEEKKPFSFFGVFSGDSFTDQMIRMRDMIRERQRIHMTPEQKKKMDELKKRHMGMDVSFN